MKKIYYEKRGSRYVPVAEYDNDWMDSFPEGNHMIMCYPGGVSRRYRIVPAYAPMIAAGRVAEEAMTTAIMKASELRLNSKVRSTPMTEEQHLAWKHLIEVFGESATQLEWASVREIAEEGIKAMTEEAEKLLQNPAVKKAYEHFMLVCELTKEEKHELNR